MEIWTDRLLLRPLCKKDLLTVHEYASDAENTRYMMFLPKSRMEETADFLSTVEKEWRRRHPSFFEFAIVMDGRQIGAVSVYLDEKENQGEIGWIVNKKYWRCGYASEAAMAVLNFAKNQLRLDSVIARCDKRNIPSARVMEKIGMRRVDVRGTRTYPKSKETAEELTYMIEFR